MKKVLITGGSGAIGSMTAYWAVRQGWEVLLAYNSNHSAAAMLKEDLENLKGKVTLFSGDLTQKEERERLAAECGEIEACLRNLDTCVCKDRSDLLAVKY